MKKEKEEDLEINLTGDETTTTTSTGEVKPKWYQRGNKSITTETSDKKKRQKAYGTNALSVIIYNLQQN